MTHQSQRSNGEIESEAVHLRRIAQELAGANRPVTARLVETLRNGTQEQRLASAAELGMLGDRESVTALRRLLEGPDPVDWEVAVHGLRNARDRSGWLCLESVALDSVPSLANESPDINRPAALRLLAMGRTKTMDRLFRAIDGHSRSIPAEAARNFVGTALETLNELESKILALRIGYPDGHGHTVTEVAHALELTESEVRRLEASAWHRVQSPRGRKELNLR